MDIHNTVYFRGSILPLCSMNGIFFNKSWENFARRQRGEFFGRLDRDVVWGGEGGCKRKERLDSLVAVYLEGSPLERWDGGGNSWGSPTTPLAAASSPTRLATCDPPLLPSRTIAPSDDFFHERLSVFCS